MIPFGNLAIPEGPMALRPTLADGLPFWRNSLTEWKEGDLPPSAVIFLERNGSTQHGPGACPRVESNNHSSQTYHEQARATASLKKCSCWPTAPLSSKSPSFAARIFARTAAR